MKLGERDELFEAGSPGICYLVMNVWILLAKQMEKEAAAMIKEG